MATNDKYNVHVQFNNTQIFDTRRLMKTWPIRCLARRLQFIRLLLHFYIY